MKKIPILYQNYIIVQFLQFKLIIRAFEKRTKLRIFTIIEKIKQMLLQSVCKLFPEISCYNI